MPFCPTPIFCECQISQTMLGLLNVLPWLWCPRLKSSLQAVGQWPNQISLFSVYQIVTNKIICFDTHSVFIFYLHLLVVPHLFNMCCSPLAYRSSNNRTWQMTSKASFAEALGSKSDICHFFQGIVVTVKSSHCINRSLMFSVGPPCANNLFIRRLVFGCWL